MKRNSDSNHRGSKTAHSTPTPASDVTAGPHGDPLMSHNNIPEAAPRHPFPGENAAATGKTPYHRTKGRA